MKKVAQWSTRDVSDWLNREGMSEYVDTLSQVDGPALLGLNSLNFQTAPLSLVSSDGGQQLLERIETLRIETHIEAHKNGNTNGHVGGLPNGTSKLLQNGMLGLKDFRREMVQIQIPTADTPRTSFPTEWGKTGLAFIYAVVCFVTTTITISVVHERVPSKEHTPPLPDKFFDLFDRVEWAFSICEINGLVLVALWLIQWILLKHRYAYALSTYTRGDFRLSADHSLFFRSIIGRRFFFIVGTLYLYRCITMYITTLPVPGMHFKCSPKVLHQHTRIQLTPALFQFKHNQIY